jgi:hypothetical protein
MTSSKHWLTVLRCLILWSLPIAHSFLIHSHFHKHLPRISKTYSIFHRPVSKKAEAKATTANTSCTWDTSRPQWLADANVVYNFAIGSNLDAEKLATRGRMRGGDPIRPLSSRPAYAPGYRLGFTLRGFVPAEPAFASIEPADATRNDLEQERSECIHGVLWELSRQDYEALWASEGGAAPPLSRPYVEQTVDVIPYGETDPVRAIAFRARPGASGTILAAAAASNGGKGGGGGSGGGGEPVGYAPSARYLRLMGDGAAAAGLDLAYVERLRRLSAAAPPPVLRWLASRQLPLQALLRAVLPPVARALSAAAWAAYGPPPGLTATALRRPAGWVRAVAMAAVLLPGACVGGVLEIVGGVLLRIGAWNGYLCCVFLLASDSDQSVMRRSELGRCAESGRQGRRLRPHAVRCPL